MDIYFPSSGTASGYVVYPEAYGARGDGSTDDTAALQAAIDATPASGALSLAPGRTYLVKRTLANTPILTRTTEIMFYGNGSKILIDATTPTTCDVFYIAPTQPTDFWLFEDLRIQSANLASGRHVFHIDTNNTDNVSVYNIHFKRVKSYATGGYTYYHNGPAFDAVHHNTGGIAYATITDGQFDGLFFKNVGDSIEISKNTVTNSGSSANAAIYVSQITGAGNLNVLKNNISNKGGAVIIDGGVSPVIAFNELEQYLASTEANNAMIDIAGSQASVLKPIVFANQIQCIQGITQAIPLRLGACSGASIHSNRISVGSVGATHIKLTTSATNARFGPDNTYDTSGTVGSAVVVDDSSGANGHAFPTGTGGSVLATSPTLVTPVLGTPSLVTLTNATGLPPAGVTFAATAKLLGRATAGAGVGQEITLGTNLSLTGTTLNAAGVTIGTTTITSGTTTKILYDNAGVVGECNALVGTNLFEFRNATNAQTLRAYNTYTDASNYAFGFLDAGVTVANTFTIGTTGLGTGATTLSKFAIYVNGAQRMDYNSTVTSGWTINGSLNVAGGSYQLATNGNFYTAGYVQSLSPTAGIGYGPGAGGTVTQTTSRTTGVTINKVTGAITLVSAAGSTVAATFTVTNSAVVATDIPRVVQKSGTDKYVINVTAVAAGSFDITFFTTGGVTTEQPVFNFAIIKGVTA